MLIRSFFKLIKWVLVIFISLILLFIIAAVLITNLINPNDYKNKIENIFYKNTGRELIISGDLHWKFVPELGLSIGKASITNPEGFNSNNPDKNNFAEINSASISINPWALVHQKIEISSIAIDGLDLNLISKSPDQNNWSFKNPNPTVSDSAVSASPAPASQVLVSPAPAKSGSSEGVAGSAVASSEAKAWPIQFNNIGEVLINNSQINFQDLNHLNKAWSLKNINLKSNNLALNQAFPLNLRFDFMAENQTINFNLQTQLFLNQNNFNLENLNLNLSAQGQSSLLSGFIKIKDFSAPSINLQLMLDQIDLSNYANLQGAKLLLGASTITANLKTVGLDPSEFPSSLNGEIHADVANMVLKGVDLGKILNALSQTAQDLASGNKLLGSLELMKDALPALKASEGSVKINPNNNQETDLGNFVYQAEVINGDIENTKLNLSGPSFEINGSGDINLNTKFVTYKLSAFNQDSTGKAVGLIVPINIQGPFSDVRTSLDMGSVKDQLKNLVKNNSSNNSSNSSNSGVSQVQENLKKAGKNLLDKFKKPFQGFN